MWREQFEILEENFIEHAEDEEDEIFDAARRLFMPEEASGLGARWQTAREKRVRQSPHA
jgi:hypothetical protein